MPASSEHQTPTRGGRMPAVAVVVASLATLGVVVVMLVGGADEPLRVQSIPAEPAGTPNWVAEPARTVPPAPPPAPPTQQAQPAQPAAQTTELTMDARGFVNTAARCAADQRAAAIAHTEHAAVVVCQDSDGSYEYQGMRLRDGAALQLDDVRPLAVGFEARNRDTTYRLSPTELVVISGESLQSRDAIVEYRAG